MDLARSEIFHDELQGLMREFHVPGLSFAVRHHEQTFSTGFGNAAQKPDAAAVPCTSETLFDIASSSKSLTAAAVALLVEDESYPDVQWDAPLSSILGEDFVMPGAGFTEGVTVEDVLSHRTGLAGHDFSYLGVKAARPDDARSVTRNVRNLSTLSPIRSKYSYCNLMYTVATYLVEVKSGLSFSDFLEEKFFKPLGMTSTSLQPSRAIAKGFQKRMALGHQWSSEKQQYTTFGIHESPEDQGAGSIITTADDYLRWATALMNHQDPITEETYKGLVRSRTFQNPDMEDLAPFSSPVLYAAGLEVFWYRGYQIVLHDGMIDGFSSRHFFLPQSNFAGVILGNSDAAGMMAEILFFRLVDELLGVPAVDRVDWVAYERKLQEKGDKEQEEWREEQKQKVLAGLDDFQPQVMPLSAYIGEYWNVGYKGMTVQIKDNKLFIDAKDRSFPMALRFEHGRDQTHFLASIIGGFDGSEEPCRAEFRFENDRAVKLGLDLELDIDDFIWFDRVPAAP